MQTNKIFQTILGLSVLGIFLASYLSLSYFLKPAYQPCDISATVNCNLVTKGELALFLGIPVGLIGLTGYVMILIGALKKNKNLVLGMSLFGTIFCLRMTILEVFVHHVYCPVCLTCQLVMLLIVIFSLKLAYNKQ